MGFLMEDSSSSSCFPLYKAALAVALIRWVISWAFTLRSRRRSLPSSAPKVSPQMIRQNLALTTYGELTWRRPQGPDTCAVCLSQLGESDEVRELRNCSHVFHRECIDQWVDHHCPDDLDVDHECYDDGEEPSSNHGSCPLCRAPLLTPSQGLDRWSEPEPEPSWAVETVLYLFADDLLC